MKILKTYIGTKIIQAIPMSERKFKGFGEDTEGTSDPGYKVLYPDGYESWSPKDVFEAAYREISPQEASLVCDVKA